MKYYKKFMPKVPVYLQNGTHILFDTLDAITGWFATQNEYILAQFDAAIQGQRGGITEVTQEVYMAEYGEKKNLNPNSRPPLLSREEVKAASILPDTLMTSAVKTAPGPAAPQPNPFALGGDTTHGATVVIPEKPEAHNPTPVAVAPPAPPKTMKKSAATKVKSQPVPAPLSP